MTLPFAPCPGSDGCEWFETGYEHYGIPYVYKSHTLTPLHAILRRKEGLAGRTTETVKRDRSLPVPYGVSRTVVGRSPGWEAVWAKRKAAVDAQILLEKQAAATEIRRAWGLL